MIIFARRLYRFSWPLAVSIVMRLLDSLRSHIMKKSNNIQTFSDIMLDGTISSTMT